MSSRGTERLQEQQAAVAHHAGSKRRPYTQEEREFVVRNHGTMTILEMAEVLKRTYFSVQGQITYLKKKGVIPKNGR